MIFLDKYAVKPRFPRNWAYPVVNLELTLFNRFTNKKHIFYNVLLDDNEIYYVLEDLDLRELDTGEYEYTLKDKTNNVVVDKGLIQIGDRGASSIQYTKKEEFIEYGK